MLLLAPPCEKILTNEGVIIRSRFLVSLITCIARYKVGLHAKIIVSLKKKIMSRRMLEICKYPKSNMSMGLLGAYINCFT